MYGIKYGAMESAVARSEHKRRSVSASSCKPAPMGVFLRASYNFGVHPITEFFLFFLVSLSTADVGWGMVVLASRIENERQERYATAEAVRRETIPSWPSRPLQRPPQ
jgi:hypothetical protein